MTLLAGTTVVPWDVSVVELAGCVPIVEVVVFCTTDVVVPMVFVDFETMVVTVLEGVDLVDED